MQVQRGADVPVYTEAAQKVFGKERYGEDYSSKSARERVKRM